ncbi:hypothetical protein JTE90_015304 [Oedothorax gibbosus]|uniref:Uncharacterized protein n=1 Tax=Oedothorax gibbosus TaxID=931172 RepID=A0AAV6VN28_9ARAC|nr:hypothetical protein JTE90_015304 [Oedothorax gibbosus]
MLSGSGLVNEVGHAFTPFLVSSAGWFVVSSPIHLGRPVDLGRPIRPVVRVGYGPRVLPGHPGHGCQSPSPSTPAEEQVRPQLQVTEDVDIVLHEETIAAQESHPAQDLKARGHQLLQKKLDTCPLSPVLVVSGCHRLPSQQKVSFVAQRGCQKFTWKMRLIR